MSSFKDLTASELLCPTCRVSQPVRERLLLVLPGGELHEYRCVACGTSVGTREVRVPPALMPGARSSVSTPSHHPSSARARSVAVVRRRV